MYIERVHILLGVQHLTELLAKPVMFVLYCVAHKAKFTYSYLVVYYLCCGEMDIN